MRRRSRLCKWEPVGPRGRSELGSRFGWRVFSLHGRVATADVTALQELSVRAITGGASGCYTQAQLQPWFAHRTRPQHEAIIESSATFVVGVGWRRRVRRRRAQRDRDAAATRSRPTVRRHRLAAAEPRRDSAPPHASWRAAPVSTVPDMSARRRRARTGADCQGGGTFGLLGNARTPRWKASMTAALFMIAVNALLIGSTGKRSDKAVVSTTHLRSTPGRPRIRRGRNLE